MVKSEGHIVVEFPRTIGVVGTLLAPQNEALGAIAALVTECSVEILRTAPPLQRSI